MFAPYVTSSNKNPAHEANATGSVSRAFNLYDILAERRLIENTRNVPNRKFEPISSHPSKIYLKWPYSLVSPTKTTIFYLRCTIIHGPFVK